MNRDGAKMFGALYTTSQSTSVASLECSRKNLRFGEAPSFTAAHTCKLCDASKTATFLQKRSIIWNDVTFPCEEICNDASNQCIIPSQEMLEHDWQ